ncbi:ERI1 exoribonuclease 3 [Willisornis vidua]|uniref:ERI1 exoribonuclease 3 n=1 Tax=Willisornis vidua TaxID=1566151 RepID=A0ABQ9CVM9_9PASS|nr:ERI1 exoribonuclease 3 [Willisornis vidua]
MYVYMSNVSLSSVSDASGCSMIALLHTGAAKFPPNLLSRARQAVYPLLLAGVLKGYSSIVSRKLASHGFGASMAAMSSFPPQRYHYFLVLDFEATCDKPQIHPQEIIEFPILKLNGRTMEIESTFHMYVQPVVHPQLTPFCTELTGIIQGMVDGQPSLQQVLERVDEWMAKEGLLDPSVKSIFVTCGDWDLKVIFSIWVLNQVLVLTISQHARGAWVLSEFSSSFLPGVICTLANGADGGVWWEVAKGYTESGKLFLKPRYIDMKLPPKRGSSRDTGGRGKKKQQQKPVERVELDDVVPEEGRDGTRKEEGFKQRHKAEWHPSL